MNNFNIIDELGPDVPLLIKPGRLLEERKRDVEQELTLLLDEAKKLTTAIAIKTKLQQTNKVAVKHSRVKSPHDEVIDVMKVSDAAKLLYKESEFVDPKIHRRHLRQINIWRSEGYNV